MLIVILHLYFIKICAGRILINLDQTVHVLFNYLVGIVMSTQMYAMCDSITK